jgi:hypothetical protein
MLELRSCIMLMSVQRNGAHRLLARSYSVWDSTAFPLIGRPLTLPILLSVGVSAML